MSTDGRNILPKGSVDDIHRLENGRAMLFLAGEAIDKFANYEDEEEKGRLVHLPLTVGDKVYAVYENDDLTEYEVASITFTDTVPPLDSTNLSSIDIVFHCVASAKYSFDSIDVSPEDFGKSVFFTMEEAIKQTRSFGDTKEQEI